MNSSSLPHVSASLFFFGENTLPLKQEEYSYPGRETTTRPPNQVLFEHSTPGQSP